MGQAQVQAITSLMRSRDLIALCPKPRHDGGNLMQSKSELKCGNLTNLMPTFVYNSERQQFARMSKFTTLHFYTS